MLKHRLAEVFTWRTLGAMIVAIVVIAPWLNFDPSTVNPACPVKPGATPDTSSPVAPSGELPPPVGASAWMPPLSDRMRQVLATGFSERLPRARDAELVPTTSSQPQLLASTVATGRLRLVSSETDIAPGDLQGPSLGGLPPAKPAPPVPVTVDKEEMPSATPWSAAKAEELRAAAPALRSEALERIAAEADRHTRHGFELAGRGAHFAARAEFIAALRVVAQGLDAERQTNAHSQALANGLTALREAEDFIPRGGHLEANLDLKAIVAGHTTNVLKHEDFARLTSMFALRHYHTYAQEQLAKAAAREVAGSMALHGLGKLHVALATRGNSVDVLAAEPKAVTFFQAAVLVYPNNALATNELGVLLARAGYYTDARAALEHSVCVSPQPNTWHNLATVYRRLNRNDLAQQAENRATAATAMPSDTVKWVLPEAFAQASTDMPQSDPPARTSQVASQAKPLANNQAAPAPVAKPALFDTVAKPAKSETPATATVKSQSSLSSLFGMPTKRPAETSPATQVAESSKPAVFDSASKPTVAAQPQPKPALFATAQPTPSAKSTAASTTSAPPVQAKAPLKPALFGAPEADAISWPRTATQPFATPTAPAEARRY